MRERDRERFLSVLFAPWDKRPHLYALYAFDLEIAHVPDAVREPMAGEIRFQWWREALAGERPEEVKANPVASALLETMSRHGLSLASLVEMIDARQFDLLGQPMESRSSLEVYLGATFGRLIELGVRILDSKTDAKLVGGLAGKVIGVTRLLRSFARDVSRGRLLVPLALLAAHDVHTASVLAGENSDSLRAALAELRQSAKMELANLRDMAINRQALPAILPAALTPLYLARMEKSGYDPFRSDVNVSAFRAQFALWRAARSGSV